MFRSWYGTQVRINCYPPQNRIVSGIQCTATFESIARSPGNAQTWRVGDFADALTVNDCRTPDDFRLLCVPEETLGPPGLQAYPQIKCASTLFHPPEPNHLQYDQIMQLESTLIVLQ